MALMYCTECGKQISDTAASCPNCGYNFEKAEKEKLQAEINKQKAINVKKANKGCVIPTLIVITIIMIYTLVNSINQPTANELKVLGEEAYTAAAQYAEAHNRGFTARTYQDSVKEAVTYISSKTWHIAVNGREEKKGITYFYEVKQINNDWQVSTRK